MSNTNGYPSDVSDEEWDFVAAYLTLVVESAPQREYPLRTVFNGLRYMIRAGCPCRRKGNKVHMAVDTPRQFAAMRADWFMAQMAQIATDADTGSSHRQQTWPQRVTLPQMGHLYIFFLNSDFNV